jgi:hydrogenase maturation protein HypF
VGRLFDAVAALVQLRRRIRFEGQAAMELEFALEGVNTEEAYSMRLLKPNAEGVAARASQPSAAPAFELNRGGTHAAVGELPVVQDWAPMVEGILADIERGLSAGAVAAKFHNALAAAVVAVARHVGETRVVLSGGCFQNRYLTERTVAGLRAAGFQPYWHQRVPPNDGGVSLGQIVAARRATR